MQSHQIYITHENYIPGVGDDVVSLNSDIH